MLDYFRCLGLFLLTLTASAAAQQPATYGTFVLHKFAHAIGTETHSAHFTHSSFTSKLASRLSEPWRQQQFRPRPLGVENIAAGAVYDPTTLAKRWLFTLAKARVLGATFALRAASYLRHHRRGRRVSGTMCNV